MRVTGSLLALVTGILGMFAASYGLMMNTFTATGSEPHLASLVTRGVIAIGLSLVVIAMATIAVRRESWIPGAILIGVALVAVVALTAPMIRWTLAATLIGGALVVLDYRGGPDRVRLSTRLYAASRAHAQRAARAITAHLPKSHPSRDPQFHA